jgi:DNA repair exonuclease SbcCD ATPase subunit
MFRLPLPITTTGQRQILSELRQQLARFERLGENLGQLAAQLDQLRKEIAALPQRADFDTLVRLMNDETNAVSTRLDSLTAQIDKQKQPDGSINAADAQAIFDALSAESDRLKQLGANPADPVPGGVGATAEQAASPNAPNPGATTGT